VNKFAKMEVCFANSLKQKICLMIIMCITTVSLQLGVCLICVTRLETNLGPAFDTQHSVANGLLTRHHLRNYKDGVGEIL